MKKLILNLLVLCSICLFSQTPSNEKWLAYLEARDLIDKGFAKYDSQDYKGAILDFNKVIELDPMNKTTLLQKAYFNRGKSKYNIGDYIGAILDFNKAIELYSDDDYSYFYRGESKINLGDKRGAILDFNKAIQLYPNKYYYFARGKANYSLGNKNDACLDWSKSGELGNTDAYDLIKKYCNN